MAFSTSMISIINNIAHLTITNSIQPSSIHPSALTTAPVVTHAFVSIFSKTIETLRNYTPQPQQFSLRDLYCNSATALLNFIYRVMAFSMKQVLRHQQEKTKKINGSGGNKCDQDTIR